MKPSEHKNTLFSPEKIIEAQNHIMPYSEYIKLGKIKFPDHYFVEGKGKKILFYEAIHSFNPDDMQFQEIPKLLQEFQPEKIFVENQEWVNNSDLFPKRKEYILQTDINTIINEKAESGYVIKISIQMDFHGKILFLQNYHTNISQNI